MCVAHSDIDSTERVDSKLTCLLAPCLRMSGFKSPGSGGFVVTDEMQKLLDQPRVLSANEEQRLRVLYQQSTSTMAFTLMASMLMTASS